MKALFFSLPLHGHVNPSLPLVRELAGRGEEIVYYSCDGFAERIAETGARYRPYRNAFLRGMRRVPERMEELSWLLMRTASEVLAEEMEGARGERPDYVITDSVAGWGQWMGEILRVPVVTSIGTCAVNRHVAAYGFRHGVRPKRAGVVWAKMRNMARAYLLLRRMRKEHGVRGPGLMGTVFGSSGLNIVYASRYFQPCGETFDERFVFAGPPVEARAEEDGFAWESLTSGEVVYVSMGTLFNEDAGFYRECFAALGDEDLQVVLAVGENVRMEELRRVPENFIVERRVPQLAVLERAAAFVTHGGVNSVMESLQRGVPLVVVPQMSEQEMNGRRVEEIGAGIYLTKESVTAESLRGAVLRVLREEGFREGVEKARASFAEAGGEKRAADAVMAFARAGQ